MAKSITLPTSSVVTNKYTAQVAALGTQVGNADNATLATLADLFAEFGEVFHAAIEVTPYKDLRTAFIGAYIATRGDLDGEAKKRAEKTGANRWAELVALIGYIKPQTDAQKKAADRMARTRAAKRPSVADQDTDKPDVPVTGHDASTGVAITLSRIDAHIISLLHSGRVAEAMKAINDTYAKA